MENTYCVYMHTLKVDGRKYIKNPLNKKIKKLVYKFKNLLYYIYVTS